MSTIEYNLLSDTELVVRLKEGEHDAYSEIYQRFFGLLYAFTYRRLNDEEESMDILQELFTDIWLKRETLEVPVLSSYLHRAVRIKMITLMVHRDVKENCIQSFKSFMEDDTIITDHLIREKQLTTMIEKEVRLLPDSVREIFLSSKQTNKQI
ncbi:RNA polymerase subunit sigma-70 [Pedobacter hiemivivus]|uniref:RNA polymerase subunit sigma-70 n=1 Tax=Pedobacter hiemivivus TaxID=2530454 RepID=A0A4V5PCY5_9SPHI|nr:sigma-70 family RNA polymerase sigma factor [Pedobacter hiemivivus]TKC62506.1 RNA polymerase subunit sigma-70 [Pedobacter hiemivivus]